MSVFGRLQVETLETYAWKMSQIRQFQHYEKEISFVLLQIVNGLKSLQAQGIEEVKSQSFLSHFLLVKTDKDPQYRLVILKNSSAQKSEQKLNLCQAFLKVMTAFWQHGNFPEFFKSMGEILQNSDSMQSLNKVQSLLEFMLWGPSDIAFETKKETREQSLQRWLDLERATVLHNLIRSSQGLWRIHLTVFEEYHLLFLVQTCAKSLQEASLLFEAEVACM